MRGGGNEEEQKQTTEEQITFALKQVELGTAVLKVCRKLGVSEQTFYRSYGASERRGCMVLKLNRGSLSAQAEAEQAFLRMWIREIAQVRVRYGYRRIHVDNGPEFISKALDA